MPDTVTAKMISIHQQSGKIDAYLASPLQTVAFRGAVIVVHEIWGLTPQIKHVAERLATQGYFALAPDLYSSSMANRRPSDELIKELFSPDDRVRYAAQPKLRTLIAPTQTPQFTSMALSRLASCFEYMYNQPLTHQRVIILGFGLGGNYVYGLALREPRLKGAISFYGQASYITSELSHISCPILAFYGEKEHSLTRELPKMIPKMRAAGVNFEPVVYGDVGHAFFNEDNPFAYSPGAASDAWHRVLGFIRDNIGVTD
jgi:carboxymethylenebutenolidase